MALLWAGSASAAYLHSSEEVTFGPNGSEQGKGNSFEYMTVREAQFDNTRHRLYMLRPEIWAPNGEVIIQPPRGIFAFDMSTPGVHTPLTGNFPLPLSPSSGSTSMAIDETEGIVYYDEGTSKPNVNRLYSWDVDGNLRPGFPKTIEHTGSMAVDPLGYLWMLDTNSYPGVLYKYDPEGNLLESLPLPNGIFYGSISFNRLTGDMWIRAQGESTKLTSASGYTVSHTIDTVGGSYEGPVAVDAADDILYVNAGNSIYAYTETGDVIEQFGVGELGEGSWFSERPTGNYGNFTNIAYDEGTGSVYAVDKRRVGPYVGPVPGGEELGSNISVWPGVRVPSAETRESSNLGHTSVTLHGHVDPTVEPVTGCDFEYISEDSYENVRRIETHGASGGTFTLVGGYGSRSQPIPYNATATQVQEALAEPTSGEVSVTGPTGGPWRVELTGSQQGKAPTLALVGNNLSPLAASVTVDWDSQLIPCNPPASSGSPITSPTDVSADVTGLNTGTTYRARLAVSGSSGRGIGTDVTFTPSPSLVETEAATEVVYNGARLNGTVDPEGLETTYYFEYGTSTEYGDTTSAPPGTNLGTTTPGPHQVSSPITGLLPATAYHFRLVAVNSKGTSYGVDRGSTTEPTVKSVETEAATEIKRDSAKLSGSLDPNGLETTYYFEWGKSPRYGNTSAMPPGVSAGSAPGIEHFSFEAGSLEPATTYHFRIVAENSHGVTAGKDLTFTTRAAVKDVTTKPADEIHVDQATLHGELDPDGFPTHFYFEWGKTSDYGHSTPLPPGNDVGTSAPGAAQVETTLENLEPGTTYHFRLVGDNSFGSTRGGDLTFSTPQPPSIEAFSSAHVSETEAELKASINPHGFETTYRFEYGPTASYGQVAPVPDGSLGALNSSQEVSVQLKELQGRTYHFRVIAESQWGTVVTEDQTFEFNPPSCPNAITRQQSGSAYLPDCRAYELVSPSRAGGAVMLPEGPFSPTARDSFAFAGGFNVIPGSGNPPNGGNGVPAADLYVSHRTQKGWVTHYVGLRGNETIEQGPKPVEFGPNGLYRIPTNDELTKFLTWDRSGAAGTYSYSPFEWDYEGNFLGRLPSNVEEIPGALKKPKEGGFIGDMEPSGDFSHYAFSSIRTAFAPEGLTESPGSAYDENIETGEIQVISKTAEGHDIPQDPLAGAVGETIRIPGISDDGSHILMSTQAPGGLAHLYMRVNDAVSYDISVGEDGINHGVQFAGMTKDGSEVYFTTPSQMTADDTDTSVDLYRWSEKTDSLTRLSVGAEGNSGNTDNCNPGWVSQCGVQVVPTGGPGSESFPGVDRDTALAKQDGAIYFYSPEQLDLGARGVNGQRNLYVWRDGSVRYVTTIEVANPIEHINVSADGSHMGMITKTPVTSYDNAGHSEMYVFDYEARKIVCASCVPDGSPPTYDVKGAKNGAFMTEDGRAFFSTQDALTPRDANNAIDVYEYVEGRPQLISTGTGDETPSSFQEAGLVGVTADGSNAFFYTSQDLVPQDENGPFYKFYDARVNGGFPFERPPAPCAAADECHGETSQPPPSPQIGSGAGLGARGNVSPSAKKKHHKKRHHKKKHHKAKRHEHRRSA